MSRPYLEVTYHKGKPFAAYLYLTRRPGDAVARSEERGSLVIDWAADDRAIGIELPSPTAVSVTELRALLSSLQVFDIDASELAPLAA